MHRIALLASVCAGLSLQSSTLAGVEPACPNPQHDCLTVGTPGCDDFQCCSLLCDLDQFCCFVAWDELCVAEAAKFCDPHLLCPQLCPANLDEDCDVDGADLGILLAAWETVGTCADLSHDGPVDGADLGVLLAAWGPCVPTCAGLVDFLSTPLDALDEILDRLATMAGLPPRQRIAQAIWIELDLLEALDALEEIELALGCGTGKDCPSPESVPRSQLKVAQARSLLARSLTKAVALEDPTLGGKEAEAIREALHGQVIEAWLLVLNSKLQLSPLFPCPIADHDCCTIGGPGCTDTACCELVCTIDPTCCDTAWDAPCVTLAEFLCGLDCDCPRDCVGTPEPEACGEDTDGGCNQVVVGDSTCCAASGGLGCDDPACQAAVCGVDSFCCEVAWDAICAGQALSLCSHLCQLLPPQFAAITCGETICGTAWADGGFRDTDWYAISFAGSDLVAIEFSCATTLPLVIGIVDTGGVPDCALAQALDPFAVARVCGAASFTACLSPGTWWFFAAPDGFDSFPCGTQNEYSIELTCQAEP